jgi:hypothetical protein
MQRTKMLASLFSAYPDDRMVDKLRVVATPSHVQKA